MRTVEAGQDAEVVRDSLRSAILLPAAVALAVLPMSNDGFDDVKLLVLVAGAGLAAWQALTRGLWRHRRPLGGAGPVAGIFLVAAVVATLTSDAPLLSFLGAATWYNGLLAYLAGVVLCVVVAGTLETKDLSRAARVLALGGALSVIFWLGQLAAGNPLGLNLTRSFMGTSSNPNFAGAFVAAALPGALWAAVRPGVTRAGRGAWAAVSVLLAVGAVGANSLQAPIAATAGVGVFCVAWAAGRSRRLAAAAAVLGVVFLLVVGLGLGRVGPLAALGRQETFVSRGWDWQAAARMAQDEPLTGVGMARFGAYVRAYRPPDDILTYGWRTQAYAAHNVPLDMAAGGGLPLLVSYLAFVGLVGVRFIGGLCRLEGQRLLLLGAFGGVWTAYQAQSMVSIDVPQLVMLHFLSAGAILALTARPRTIVPSGGAEIRSPLAARVVAAALALTAVVFIGRVCLAELALGAAARQAAHGEDLAALRATQRAVALVPWHPSYRARLGATQASVGADHAALAAYLQAVDRDPRELFHLLDAADQAMWLGSPQIAMRLLRDALRIEPQAAKVKVEAAEAALALGDVEEARRLVEAALAFEPDNFEAARLRTQIVTQRG